MGFLFLVLYPPPPARPFLLLTHLTHSLTHSLTHALTHSLTLTHSHSLTHTHSLSLTHSLTLTHTHSHSLTLTHTHSLHSTPLHSTPLHSTPLHLHSTLASLWRLPLASLWRPSGVPLASLWRPSGVPWAPRLLRGRRGTMCTAKGSDVRPGVPLVGQCALPRGRMYALASLWCPSGVPWAPLLLRGRRGAMCTAKGSDVRPGVLWRPFGVPLASLWCPLASAAFAWQAWDNVHCQGVGCTPWRPSGVLASLWRPSGVPWARLLLRGRRGTMCTAKGSMYALTSLWRPLWCPLGSAASACFLQTRACIV